MTSFVNTHLVASFTPRPLDARASTAASRPAGGALTVPGSRVAERPVSARTLVLARRAVEAARTRLLAEPTSPAGRAGARPVDVIAGAGVGAAALESAAGSVGVVVAFWHDRRCKAHNL